MISDKPSPISSLSNRESSHFLFFSSVGSFLALLLVKFPPSILRVLQSTIPGKYPVLCPLDVLYSFLITAIA